MSSEKLHLRIGLPALFKQHGLPEYSQRYLYKLSTLGEGPPIAAVYAGRARYAEGPALAWARARIARQTKAVLDRQEHNGNYGIRKSSKRSNASSNSRSNPADEQRDAVPTRSIVAAVRSAAR
jgi:hypothetical protein